MSNKKKPDQDANTAPDHQDVTPNEADPNGVDNAVDANSEPQSDLSDANTPRLDETAEDAEATPESSDPTAGDQPAETDPSTTDAAIDDDLVADDSATEALADVDTDIEATGSDATSETGDHIDVDDEAVRDDDEPDTLSDDFDDAEPSPEDLDVDREDLDVDRVEEIADEIETSPSSDVVEGETPAFEEPVAAPVEPLRSEPQEKIVERVVEKRGGFVPALIGGLIAVAIGFVAGRSGMLDSFLPASLRGPDTEAQVETLKQELATLQKWVDDQKPVDLSPLQSQIADLGTAQGTLKSDIDSLSADLKTQVEGAVAPLSSQLSKFETDLGTYGTRLTDVEKRPIAEGLPEAAIQAYQREFDGLQKTLNDQKAAQEKAFEDQKAALAQAVSNQEAEFQRILNEAKTRENAAEAAARKSAAASALSDVRSALDDGSAFDAPVKAIETAGYNVDQGLSASASEGVPTLALLIDEFPASARAALATVRADEETVAGDIKGFLTRQLGARSVVPREGDDPDAVLSRVEAALKGGQIKTALIEIEALPEDAKAELQDWVAEATRRQSAVDAANALAAQLNAN